MTENTKLVKQREGGFTLVEMIIAIMIYGIVLAAGIGFVAMQNTLFHRGLDRMTALQNLRYALNSMETDIPTLGTNVPTVQPSLVYAGPTVLAFTGDYASNVANDVFASYIDLAAPNGQVTVPNPTVTIPTTSYTWPDTLYLTTAGTRSPAELLVYWFDLDTTTTRTDDYVLYRQVNDYAPEPLARNILASPDTTPFFQYLRRIDYASAASAVAMIPDASLPITHSSTFHRVAADTAASALADSIRAVRVTFRSTNGLEGDAERIVSASRMIDMPNAGFTLMQTCGDEPIMGDTLGASIVDLGGGDYVARLIWNAAVDETAGEQDVARYVIYKQATPIGTDWGDPYLSIPAGLPDYTFDDGLITNGMTYQYALSAQDCTPMLSPLETSPLVVVQRSKSKQHDLAEIARLARGEEADVIVYGLPLNMDGSMSKAAKAATYEAKQLATLVDVPVEMHDERLTTVSADRSMLDAGLNAQQRRQVVDKVAAAIMLQSWLDARAIRIDRETEGLS